MGLGLQTQTPTCHKAIGEICASRLRKFRLNAWGIMLLILLAHLIHYDITGAETTVFILLKCVRMLRFQPVHSSVFLYFVPLLACYVLKEWWKDSLRKMYFAGGGWPSFPENHYFEIVVTTTFAENRLTRKNRRNIGLIIRFRRCHTGSLGHDAILGGCIGLHCLYRRHIRRHFHWSHLPLNDTL